MELLPLSMRRIIIQKRQAIRQKGQAIRQKGQLITQKGQAGTSVITAIISILFTLGLAIVIFKYFALVDVQVTDQIGNNTSTLLDVATTIGDNMTLIAILIGLAVILFVIVKLTGQNIFGGRGNV